MKTTVGTCLVVDDVPATRHQVNTWMTEIGFACLNAANGLAALEILRDRAVDILITDIDMPLFSGFDLLRSVRESSDDRVKQLPILVISSLADCKIESMVRSSRADSLALKPFEKSSFLDAVFRTLRRTPSWGAFSGLNEDVQAISPRLRCLHDQAVSRQR